MFPYEKYKYFTNGVDLVVAEQTYAGKKYRGKARLGSGDEFDLEKGKKLAAARCDDMICRKRFDYAMSKWMFYRELEKFAQKNQEDMKQFIQDALTEVVEANQRLSDIEKELGLVRTQDDTEEELTEE